MPKTLTVKKTQHYTVIVPAMPDPETMPVETRWMNTAELLKTMREHFCSPEAGDEPNPTYTYYRGVANAIFDPAGWKNPVAIDTSALNGSEYEWIKAVIIWYHGTDADYSGDYILSPGYACD